MSCVLDVLASSAHISTVKTLVRGFSRTWRSVAWRLNVKKKNRQTTLPFSFSFDPRECRLAPDLSYFLHTERCVNYTRGYVNVSDLVWIVMSARRECCMLVLVESDCSMRTKMVVATTTIYVLCNGPTSRRCSLTLTVGPQFLLNISSWRFSLAEKRVSRGRSTELGLYEGTRVTFVSKTKMGKH